jgi:hypothetical protein
MRPGTLDVEVHDADGLELRGTSDHRVEQHGWCCRGAMDVDLIPRTDAGNRCFRCDDLHA